MYAPWPADQADARRQVRVELIRFLLTHNQVNRSVAELIALDGELELLRMRQALQARHFRGQFQRLGNEPLIFAIEEETDLTERFKIAFLTQLHYPRRI